MKKYTLIILIFATSLIFAVSGCKTNRRGIVPCPCHGSIEQNNQNVNNSYIDSQKI